MNNTPQSSAAQTDLRLEYELRRLIDEQLDVLIPQICELVNQTGLCNNTCLERKQLTNLENVARETDSVYVVLNWIQYQIGRQSAWREGDLGYELVKKLKGLNDTAHKLVQKAGGGDDPRLVRQVWMRLVRQYVGQLQRFVVACRTEERLLENCGA